MLHMERSLCLAIHTCSQLSYTSYAQTAFTVESDMAVNNSALHQTVIDHLGQKNM